MKSLFLICGLAMYGAEPSGAVLKPGDNLVVEGIADIPESIVEEAGRYTDFRGAVMLAETSKDAGKLLSAFVTSLGGTTPRWMSMIRRGNSRLTARPIVSDLRSTPGPLVAVIPRLPANAAKVTAPWCPCQGIA